MQLKKKTLNVGGILAGGIGSRMSSGGLPKQLMEVGGIPVIVRTINAFLSCGKLDFVLVAMNSQWRGHCDDLIDKNGVARSRLARVDGGATRFESLVNLSKAALERSDGADCILLNHDCARPFVSQRILSDCLEMVGEFDMVTTSMPTIDTVLISSDGRKSDSVPPRSTIFLDQGPQAFRVKQFLALEGELTDEERQTLIEAGRMYLAKGLAVGIVKGDRNNFKLTTPFDMVLAEAMLKEGIIE